MWYTDEDDDVSELLDNVEKEETSLIKKKAFYNSHQQQLLQLSRGAKTPSPVSFIQQQQQQQQEQEQQEKHQIKSQASTTLDINNNKNKQKMNNHDEDEMRMSIEERIGSGPIALNSDSHSRSPSQSPLNVMTISSDAMFVIEDDSTPTTSTSINLKLPNFISSKDNTNVALQKPTAVSPMLISKQDDEDEDENPLKKASTIVTPLNLSGDDLIINKEKQTASSTVPSASTTAVADINSPLVKDQQLDSNNNNSNSINLSTLSLHDHNILIGKLVFSEFLKKHTCYDVIPISGKVVVLDTKLVVKSAFYALEENGIKSAPLWSPDLQDFTGMITVSDFIDILLYYYYKPKSDNIFQDMGIHRIETFWREINVERPKTLIYTEPETNLYDAATLLLEYRIHRLPVVDKKETNSILHILTHSRILAFMMKSLPDLPTPLLSCTLGSLGIGTFEKVCTVHTHTPLIKVLELLAEKKISAVPIIDENGKVIDVYSKSDVTLMAKQGNLSPTDLDKPVHQVLTTFTKLWQRAEQTYTCTKNDKLGDVIEKCIKRRVHRLVCVDSGKKVEGILSLSDILSFLLNKK